MFSDLRTAFWHLREGGIKQLGRHLEFKERQRMQTSEDPEDKAAVESFERESLRGFDPMDFPEFVPNTFRKKPFSNFRVGVIFDDFSWTAWDGEFTLVELTPDNWESEINDIDFLLIESAWQGNQGAWRYQIVGTNAPSTGIVELVEKCKARGIPTVFWNKEDPEHFSDFISTACLFDYVGTTDSNCLEMYESYPGFNGQVFSLPFAAQPSVHNPMRDQISARRQIGDVCFAGTYFRHKFVDRREQMDLLLTAGIDASKNLRSALTIYSRNETVDEKYSFPQPFDDWVVDALPYSQMLSAYRGYKVFLNVNTVTDSPTMFSRRALELLASGTPVVSTDSLGLRSFFNESEICIVSDSVQASQVIESLVRSSISRDVMVHKAQRTIWENHTYSHRAARLLDVIGFESANNVTQKPRVSVIMPTMRPENLDFAIAQIRSQIGVELEILVATHGFSVEEGRYAGIQFLEFPKDIPLGACLNALVEKAQGQYVAKIDDDDLYGPNYLRDQIHALRYSGATVVGKQASYLYIENTEELIIRKKWREHMWSDMVLGATIVAERSVFESTKFKEVIRGEDTGFLNDILENGGRIYAADRFNYIQIRSAVPHTWDISELDLKRNGQVETFGLNTKHVFVGEA